MHTDHHILVTFESQPSPRLLLDERKSEHTLTNDTSPIHSLVWVFKGIEGLVAHGWTPAIHFEIDENRQPDLYSGPFINLCRTRSTVIACGNNGIDGEFRYRALLEPPADTGQSIVPSNAGLLKNEVLEARPAVIEVHHTEGRRLVVQREQVSLCAGQSILWEVIEPPSQIPVWYPRIVFDIDRGPSETNPYFGPFGSIDTRDHSLLATGSTDVATGKYHYRFQMVSVADHTVLLESSPDPTIDDQGDPGVEGPPTALLDDPR